MTLSIGAADVAAPGEDEIVVRIDAAPINPSDLGLLLGGADAATFAAAGTDAEPVVTATLPPAALRAAGARLEQSMPVGNEGAGIVIEAGSSAAAQALVGRTVAILGGPTYTQYRTVRVSHALVLPEGTTPQQGASCFVNPLTALGMVETMRLEGHTALLHTAAASNLGQMLLRICLADGVPLVNVVRRPEQAELLRSQGAEHVCDSSSDTFMADLVAALTATGATIAFDATGGGKLVGYVLSAMEQAASANAKEFSRYGSTVHKQAYIYGGLDRGPTEFNRSFGMAWSIGGWLLTPFLQKIGPAAAQVLRERVASEITTTFASSYVKTVSLNEALDVANLAVFSRQATGEKFLLNPNG